MDEQPELTQSQPEEMVTDEDLEMLEIAMQATQAALNLDWDTAQKLNALATSKAEAYEGAEAVHLRTAVSGLVAMTEGLIVELRDQDAQRYERAVQYFRQAQSDFEKLAAAFPENVDHQNALTSTKIQILWLERSMASEQGDQKAVLRREAQFKSLINEVPEESKQEFMRYLSFLQYANVMVSLKEIPAALGIMDLSRALQIITNVRQESAAMLMLHQEMPGEALFQGFQKASSGIDEIVEAMLIYVQVLCNAIVRDVSRADIEKLDEAVVLYRSGAKKVSEGQLIMNERFSEKDAEALEASFTFLIDQTRHLKELCQESLKPKRWLAGASVKFVVFFLFTAVMLLVAVTATNIGEALGQAGRVEYILLISFLVGLIGGFGFEALRFLPFVNVLSRPLPGAADAMTKTEDG